MTAKPANVTSPQKCDCNKGKTKEWGDGPYAEYDWVTCGRCDGTTIVSVEVLNAENYREYGQRLTRYEADLARHKLLKKIKISKEQLDALWSYGYGNFLKDYINNQGGKSS